MISGQTILCTMFVKKLPRLQRNIFFFKLNIHPNKCAYEYSTSNFFNRLITEDFRTRTEFFFIFGLTFPNTINPCDFIIAYLCKQIDVRNFLSHWVLCFMYVKKCLLLQQNRYWMNKSYVGFSKHQKKYKYGTLQ